MKNKELASAILTYTFAVFLFAIGIDKIAQIDFIANWQSFIGPVIHFLVPLSTKHIVDVEGVIEIAMGVLLLTRWKVIGLASLITTILIVIIDLVILHFYNLAVRELVLVVVCFATYLLDERTPEWGK